jgi:hypothetical protein
LIFNSLIRSCGRSYNFSQSFWKENIPRIKRKGFLLFQHLGQQGLKVTPPVGQTLLSHLE